MRKMVTIGLTLALGMGTWAGMAAASDTETQKSDRSEATKQLQVRGRQTVWVQQDAKPAYALTGQATTRSDAKDSEKAPRFDVMGRSGTRFQAR